MYIFIQYYAELASLITFVFHCRPEWIGEAMVKGIEDDNVNGVAMQLLSRDPVYHFAGPNDTISMPKV